MTWLVWCPAHQTRDSHVVSLIEYQHIQKCTQYHSSMFSMFCISKYSMRTFLYGLYKVYGGWQSDVKRASTLFQCG